MGIVMYYQWASREDFDLWHDALCEQLDYPQMENGVIITESYTSPFIYNGVFIAFVEEKYADGLNSIDYDRSVIDR